MKYENTYLSLNHWVIIFLLIAVRKKKKLMEIVERLLSLFLFSFLFNKY